MLFFSSLFAFRHRLRGKIDWLQELNMRFFVPFLEKFRIWAIDDELFTNLWLNRISRTDCSLTFFWLISLFSNSQTLDQLNINSGLTLDFRINITVLLIIVNFFLSTSKPLFGSVLLKILCTFIYFSTFFPSCTFNQKCRLFRSSE